MPTFTLQFLDNATEDLEFQLGEEQGGQPIMRDWPCWMQDVTNSWT